MKTDEIYMRRALQLARNGALDASPNPMVGAVIVAPDGTVIGEGWHRKCGEGHAEVNAVNSVGDRQLLRDCTMYVTLEPCSHYGKTPPCAKLIIDMGIPRVVVGCLDPFVKVAGRGVRMLEDAGVEVVTGFLEDECRELNRKFMTAHTSGRPFITLKWAESSDGYIDGKISTPLTSMLVHRERALHDAILVGSGTFLADSPRLDTRLYAGHSPRRVVLDRRGRIDSRENPDIMLIHDDAPLAQILGDLYSKGITSLLVEGGRQVLDSFITEELWDTIRVEQGAVAINGSVKAPSIEGAGTVRDSRVIDGNRITLIDRIRL